jgi:hypothetical protein
VFKELRISYVVPGRRIRPAFLRKGALFHAPSERDVGVVFVPCRFGVCSRRLSVLLPANASQLRAYFPGGPVAQHALTSGILFFRYSILGSPLGRTGWGTAMDSALHELIAQIRGTTAALAEAEQRVASFTSELAQQPRLAQPDAAPAQPIRTPIAKRGTSGWVAAG